MGRITGIVRTSSGDNRIEGVNISFGGKSTSSDEYGFYEIRNPPNISGIIKFQKSGYNSYSRGVSAPLGNDTTYVNVRLSKYAPPQKPKPRVISGNVRELETGLILRGVRVEFGNRSTTTNKRRKLHNR